MSRFGVDPSVLSAASGYVAGPAREPGRLAGVEGVASGTPPMFAAAFEEFVLVANAALVNVSDVSEALSGALGDAAGAYEVAERTAAGSFKGSGE